MTWDETTIGECCKVVGGSTPRRNNPDFWDGDIPWVTPKDISDLETPFISETPEQITRQGYESCSTDLLPEGTVLLSSRAPIGLVAIVARKMCTNQGFKSLIPSERVDSLYLYHYLKSSKDRLQNMGNGSTFKEISKEVTERITIPLPPLDTQKKIAAVLDKADSIRRKRKQVIAKLDELLKSVFLEMFGNPVTNPKGWDTRPLGNFFAEKPRIGTITPASPDVGDYRIVRVGEIGDYRIDVNQCARIQLSAADAERFRLSAGDFVLARAIGSEDHLGKSSVVSSASDDLVFDSHVMRLRFLQDMVHPTFFWHWLKSQGGRHRFMKEGGRTAVQFNINAEQVGRIIIPLPPIQEQKQFVLVAEKLTHGCKESVTVQLQEAENLLKSLLQRAFKGEIEFNDKVLQTA